MDAHTVAWHDGICMLHHLRTRSPLLVGLFIIFFGIFVSEKFALYARWDQFDPLLHALGGLTAAWFGLALFQDDITHMAAWKQILLFVGFAALVGVLWEFAEYRANFARETLPWLWHWFHGGDLTDTMTDLAADVTGAVALTLWALWRERA